jgi:hypothetical protein
VGLSVYVAHVEAAGAVAAWAEVETYGSGGVEDSNFCVFVVIYCLGLFGSAFEGFACGHADVADGEAEV